MMDGHFLDNRVFLSSNTGIMAGSVCPAGVLRNARQDLNMTQITVCYGMTETSPVSFQTPAVGTPIEKQVSTVGKVLPWTEAKVVRKDGETARIDEPGELYTRGYLVMKGYWGDEEKTKQVSGGTNWEEEGRDNILL